MAWRLRRIALSQRLPCYGRGPQRPKKQLRGTRSDLLYPSAAKGVKAKAWYPKFSVAEGATVLMYTIVLKEAKDPVISCERKERSTMGDIRVAVRKSPMRIKITDSDALMEHAQVLQIRSRSHDLIDQQLRPARQRVEEAKLRLREAEVAEEQVKLALDAIGLQERKAVERFYTAIRNAHSQVRTLAERYGGDVAFVFDSDGRSVWVMALFEKSAPPSLRMVPVEAVSWPSMDEDQEDSSTEEEEDES